MIGKEIRLPPTATPLKMPAPSPANKSSTTWDAGMPEQYGTAGGALLTCRWGPVHGHRPPRGWHNTNCSQAGARLTKVPRFLNEGRGALRGTEGRSGVRGF